MNFVRIAMLLVSTIIRVLISMLQMQAFTDYSSKATPTSLVIDRYRGDADVSGGRVGEVAIVEGEKWRRNHVTSLQPIKNSIQISNRSLQWL